MSKQVAVWLDRQRAHLFHLRSVDPRSSVVSAGLQAVFHKPKQGSEPPKDIPADTLIFFREIASALRSADEILLLGPSIGKLEFERYLAQREPKIEAAVIGIETADHPADGTLEALAQLYLARKKRTL